MIKKGVKIPFFTKWRQKPEVAKMVLSVWQLQKNSFFIQQAVAACSQSVTN